MCSVGSCGIPHERALHAWDGRTDGLRNDLAAVTLTSDQESLSLRTARVMATMTAAII